MTAKRQWVLAIVGLLGGNALAMVLLLVSARSGGGAQVIPNYYERAARFDDTLDQAARNRALGWKIAVAIEGDTVTIDARGSTGAPLAGARVRVAGHHRSQVAHGFELEAAAIVPGRHRAVVPGPIGHHDLTIAVEHGGARFVESATVDVR